MIPQFLHIGYSKAASTWLQDLLGSHPGFYLVSQSYFFHPDNPAGSAAIGDYEKLFAGKKEHQVGIESDEHYIMPFHHPVLRCAATNLSSVQEVARSIAAMLPSIKIIVIVRNQIDMLISRYLQYVLQGGTKSPFDFYDHLVFRNGAWLAYADYRYHRVFELLTGVFGSGNVCMLFQEELKHDPAAFCRTLAEFTGISLAPPKAQTAHRARNAGASYMSISLLRGINKLYIKEVETRSCRAHTRLPYATWFYLTRVLRRLDNILVKNKGRERILTGPQRRMIKSIFAKDNAGLARRFGKPLDAMGYRQHTHSFRQPAAAIQRSLVNADCCGN